MKKLGFWNDSHFAQRSAINEAAEELAGLQSNTRTLQQQVEAQRVQLRAQRTEINQLKAAMQAICDLIVDLDLVEESALTFRIDAAMAEIPEVKPAAAPVSPFDIVAEQPKTKVRTEVECALCQRKVAAREITFTDRGPACSQCINAAEG
jgi:hypothetical protein